MTGQPMPPSVEDLLEEYNRAVPTLRDGQIARRADLFEGLMGTLRQLGKQAHAEKWSAMDILGALNVVLQRTVTILAQDAQQQDLRHSDDRTSGGGEP